MSAHPNRIDLGHLNQNKYNISTYVYLLKYHFESHLIYKWRYYRQTILNQLNIMVPYIDIIGLCFSVATWWKIYVMRPKCHVKWLRSHFKRMLIYTGLGKLILIKLRKGLIFDYLHTIRQIYAAINILWYHFYCLNTYSHIPPPTHTRVTANVLPVNLLKRFKSNSMPNYIDK